MPENACPDPEQLEQMLLGKLPETEREAIGEHLQQCEPCTVAADTVVAQDDLTAAIRARRIPSGDEDVLSEAIERGKKLGQKLETQVPEGTAIAGVQANPSATVTGLKVDAAAEQFDFLAPAEQPDEIGRLGDYRILQVLGIGGMGVVFLAEDDKLKRQVALKVMKPSVAASQSSKERFLREAQFTAAIELMNAT
jgi:hypothetical protein